MKVYFTKMSGSGNDFIIIDNRSGKYNNIIKSSLIKFLCKRRISIGADGVIFLEHSKKADVKMHHYNPDGSKPAMCGNGARCIAYFSHIQGLPKNLTIETNDSVIKASVDNTFVSIQMPDAKFIEYDIPIDELSLKLDTINTGVPHAVVIVDSIDSIPIKLWGEIIRYHEKFAPNGTNVDFVEIIGDNSIQIRTYERGVEDETLACGTGAVACAIVATRRKLVEPPVEIIVRLLDILNVDFDMNFPYIKNIVLSGNVIESFRGTVEFETEILS